MVGKLSIRLNAFSTPPSSTTAMTIGVPISLALASAPAMIRCAASVLMLAFGNVSAMSPPPPLERERRRAYRPAARRREARRQPRMTARTSSRLRSMSSGERSDSSVRRSSGSVFEGRTLKCQSG